MKTEQQVSEQVKAWAIDRAIETNALPKDVISVANALIEFTIAEGVEAQDCRSWAIDRAINSLKKGNGKDSVLNAKEVTDLAGEWSRYVYVPEAHEQSEAA